MRFYVGHAILPKALEGGVHFSKDDRKQDKCPMAGALLKIGEVESVYIGENHVTVRKNGIDPW